MSDQRRFQRIEFDSPVRFTTSERSIGGVVSDISLKGILIQTESTPDLDFTGTKGEIEIDLPGSDEHIEMQVRCIHQHEKTLGLETMTIDIKSAAHLRRLMELNLGSEDMLSRELTTLVEAYLHQ